MHYCANLYGTNLLFKPHALRIDSFSVLSQDIHRNQLKKKNEEVEESKQNVHIFSSNCYIIVMCNC